MGSIDYPIIARVALTLESVSNQIANEKNVLFVTSKVTELIIKETHISLQIKSNNNLNDGDTVLVNNMGIARRIFINNQGSQTLFLTAKCNSNCIMCPYTSSFRKHEVDYPIELVHEMIEYLPDCTQHLVVTGGEPTLLGNNFFSVMKAIKERFPQIVCLLLTNGRTFSIPTIIETGIKSFPKHTTAAIPIHAANEILHDQITQSPGSFKQTIQGIYNLLHTNIRIEIRIVVFKENINEMMDIAQLICNLPRSVFVVHFMAAEMCGNAAINHNQVWIDYTTAFNKCASAVDLLINNGIDVELYNFPLCSVPQKYWALYRRSISDYKIHYGDKCSECAMQNICGGVFASSLKYAESEMNPISGEQYEN